MKKILVLSLSFFLITPMISLAEWVQINKGEIFHTYTDLKSLNVQPDGTYAWALYDFIELQPEGYRSAKVLFQIDCEQIKYKMLSVNTFGGAMGEGDVGIMPHQTHLAFMSLTTFALSKSSVALIPATPEIQQRALRHQ
jgi:hypothetical protein